MSKAKLSDNRLRFHCPGCDDDHQVTVYGATAWTWNRNLDKPTIRPSIRVQAVQQGKPALCHSFVTDGKIQFMTDSTHALAGHTVELPELSSSNP